VRVGIYLLNFLTRWRLCGVAKKVPVVEGESDSISTATVRFEVAPRGWNIFYVAEYDVLYRPVGTEDWEEVKNIRNELKREKSDRTRKREAKLKKMKDATKYEIRIATRCPRSTSLSNACYIETQHKPSDEWGLFGDGFTWSQTNEEVNVKVTLPEKTRGRQVSVKCNGQELTAEITPDKEGFPDLKKLL